MNQEAPVFTREEIATEFIPGGMVRDGLPLTRENHIIRNWGEMPEDWSAECEAALPGKLQHGSLDEEDD